MGISSSCLNNTSDVAAVLMFCCGNAHQRCLSRGRFPLWLTGWFSVFSIAVPLQQAEKIRSTAAVLMSIKCLCCSYYATETALVYVSPESSCVYVQAYVSELSVRAFLAVHLQKWVQWPAKAKSCKGKRSLETAVWLAHRANLVDRIHADTRKRLRLVGGRNLRGIIVEKSLPLLTLRISLWGVLGETGQLSREGISRFSR